MIEEEQSILSGLLEAREELYQRGTQYIFEALKPVLDSITSFMNVEDGAIEWAAVEKIQDYVIIAGVVHFHGNDGRAIRVGLPLHLAEKGNPHDIMEFLKKAKIRAQAHKATQLTKGDTNTFDLHELSSEQLDKVALSMYTAEKIDPQTRH